MRTLHRSERTDSARVLRDVPTNPAPHELRRPGAIAPSSIGKTHGLHAKGRAETFAGKTDSTPADDTFQRGFAQGREEGVAAGRELEALDHQQARQTAMDEARREGFESGRAEGLSKGEEDAREQTARAEEATRREAAGALAEGARRIEQLLQSLLAATEDQRAIAEEDLVALGFESLCRVLGREAASAESLRSVVRHLLAAQGARVQLEVHVHPDDMALLPAAQDNWRWVADESVQLGGVILRSPQGSLDARLEVQLAALREALVNTREKRRAADKRVAPVPRQRDGMAS
jgi:flagellar assembly protein FliH